MAWDALCIPLAMSAKCERVFSSASRMIGGYQVNMKEDAIEATECLKDGICSKSRLAKRRGGGVRQSHFFGTEFFPSYICK